MHMIRHHHKTTQLIATTTKVQQRLHHDLPQLRTLQQALPRTLIEELMHSSRKQSMKLLAIFR